MANLLSCKTLSVCSRTSTISIILARDIIAGIYAEHTLAAIAGLYIQREVSGLQSGSYTSIQEGDGELTVLSIAGGDLSNSYAAVLSSGSNEFALCEGLVT